MTKPIIVPKVSVIMPVYNAEKFLQESLDSILRQTYANFELIIINDGSTDSSQNIIDQYAARDSRIIKMSQKNQGVVATANKAIMMARGDYIARMDADDVSLPDRLAQQAKILDRHKNTVLVCSNFEVFDEQGEFRYREVLPPENAEIKRALYLRNPIANGSTLIRKTALKEVGLFDDVFAEDFHMWMKLRQLGNFESTGTTLYRWRMNPSGLTLSNNSLSMQQGKAYIDELWANSKPKYMSRKDILAVSNHYFKDYALHGIAYKKMFLIDMSQLAAKLFLRGSYLQGIRQFFAVASTGRTGLKIALQRVHLISKGRYSKLRKKVPFGRNS